MKENQCSTYPATVRMADLDETELTAELTVTVVSVSATTASGEFSIPLKRLQIALMRDGAWMLSDPEHEDWVIMTGEARLLDHPLLRRVPHLYRQLRELKASQAMRRSLRLSLAFLGVFAVVITMLLLVAPRLVRLAVGRIPYPVEAAWGATAAADVTRRVSALEDPPLEARLAAVTNRLATALQKIGHPCQFAILDTSEVNALALPGGRVFVTRGLLLASRNGEELAGVIAHELAHVWHRHGLESLVGFGGPVLVTQLMLGTSPGPAGSLIGSSQQLLGLSYSRDHEHEADETGFRFLVAANIDPRGMLEFMRRMDGAEEAEDGGAVPQPEARTPPMTKGRTSRAEDVFRTHPLTPDRVARLESLWLKLPRKTSFSPVPWP